MKMKACAVVGRGAQSLLGGPGSELRPGSEKEKRKRVKIIDGISNQKTQRCMLRVIQERDTNARVRKSTGRSHKGPD